MKNNTTPGSGIKLPDDRQSVRYGQMAGAFGEIIAMNPDKDGGEDLSTSRVSVGLVVRVLLAAVIFLLIFTDWGNLRVLPDDLILRAIWVIPVIVWSVRLDRLQSRVGLAKVNRTKTSRWMVVLDVALYGSVLGLWCAMEVSQGFINIPWHVLGFALAVLVYFMRPHGPLDPDKWLLRHQKTPTNT